MQTIEELQEKQEKEMNELQRKHYLAKIMPMIPRFAIVSSSKGYPDTVCYEVHGLGALIELFGLFVIVPFDREGSRLLPAELLKQPDGSAYALRWDLDFDANDRYAAELTAHWFTRINDEIIAISVNVNGLAYLGRWQEFVPAYTRTGVTHRSKIRGFHGNAIMGKHVQASITWSNSHAPSTWHTSYLLPVGVEGEHLGTEHVSVKETVFAIGADALKSKAGGQ